MSVETRPLRGAQLLVREVVCDRPQWLVAVLLDFDGNRYAVGANVHDARDVLPAVRDVLSRANTCLRMGPEMFDPPDGVMP